MTDTPIAELDQITVTGPRRRLRRPRHRIFVDGTELPGLLDAQVTLSNYFAADTFDATYAAFASPDFGPDWWMAKVAPLPIKIELGNEDADGNVEWQEVLRGVVDSIDADYGSGTVQISGRDNTAKLIDNKVTQNFRNQTASEIVTTIAAGRGLTADVTATTAASGAFYRREHTSSHADTFKNATEWDTIVHLARCEGYDAWVDGDTLYFHPTPTAMTDPYMVVFSPPSVMDGHSIAGVTETSRLRVTHNLNLTKDIRVIVRSWHSGLGRGFTATAGVEDSGDEDGGRVQEHTFSFPGLTQEQVQERADRLYDEMTRHEYILSFDAPATLRLNPRKGVRLQGVTGAVDQDYFVDEVQLSLNYAGGFTMQVRAKNHPEGGEK